MNNISFFVNSSLADSFIQELFVGCNLNPQFEEMFLKFARYDNFNNYLYICISLDDGNEWIDIFKYECNYNNETPPDLIRMESSGIYKGVDCYAVVNWNAISDPSLAQQDGMVPFYATISMEAATVLDNSPRIKHFIYDHALDDLSRDAVANYPFTRESWATPNVSNVIVTVGSYDQFKSAILQNNVTISLSSDIAIEKSNELTSDTSPNGINPHNESLDTLINFRGKNLIINGNGHKVYEKGTSLQVTPSQDGNWYEAPFNGVVTEDKAFITPNGTIIPIARSKAYHSEGWQINGSFWGISIPDELQNLYNCDTENVFVCFRFNYQRIVRKIMSATTEAIYFTPWDSYTLNELNSITPNPDFFLINYKGNGNGALIKNNKVSIPQSYGCQFSQCWTSHLFRVKENSNVVFNDVTFIGGLDYSVRNDGHLRLNDCHFINQTGGGVTNYRRMVVDQCCFTDIFSCGVRFEHIHGTDNPQPYLEVTNSTFRNIAHYGSSSFAVWSTGKAYIAYNEFIDTNYGAIRIGVDNCSSVSSLHSENLVEWNYIHYTPEWIQERRLLGLQNSGAITIVTNNQKAIVRFNRIVNCGGPKKNIGIYGNNGAYNMEIYGNVISGTENFYDIDCWDASPSFTGQTPNGSNNDVNTNNLIAYNIFDGYIRIQENSCLATASTTQCSFKKNYKLEPNPKMIIEPGDDNVHENVFNQVVGYLNGGGIMTDESGIVAAAYLSVLGNDEPVNS